MSAAKPYQHISTPFPLELDRRFVDQSKRIRSEKGKRRQKTPSESVRCYWALMSARPSEVGGRLNQANLVFLHLDPALEEALGYSVESLVGTSALDLVHPKEAKRIEKATLRYISKDGSTNNIFRCTMKSVLSMGRYVHSSLNDRKLDFSLFAQSSENDHQLTDLRLELIGDEMVLCFFHAVEDRSKQDYNQDEKTQWSNWCETSLNSFDDQHCQVLWEHILTERLKKPSCSAIERHKNGFPKKVFQILTNGPESSILFSWPPPRLFESMQDEFSKSNTETYGDGSYFADVFASLTYRLHFEEKYSGDFEILTACKKNLQTAMALNTDGFAIDLQIMMIPHGEIKFVIVSISKAEYLAAQEPKRSEIYNLPSAMEQRYPYPLYENFGTTLPEQERKHPDYTSNTHPSQIYRQIDPLGDSPWVQAPQDFTHFPVSWMSDGAMSGNRQENYLVEGNEEQAFPPMMNGALSQAQPAGLPNQPDQSIYGSLSGPQNESSSSLPSYSHHGQSLFPPAIMESSEKVCTACGSKNSPEWRPGPEGVKSLCNACGLRFSRANAKVQKREKDARTASEMIAGGVLTPAHTGEEVDNKCDFKRGRSAKYLS